MSKTEISFTFVSVSPKKNNRSAKVAEIISVGDELIRGMHVDLNAPYLSQSLLDLGVPTEHFQTVPDHRESLALAIQEAASRADFVFVSGGLGPTEDDITRHAAADAAKQSLRFDEPTWNLIHEQMSKRGRVVSKSNRLSATFPKTATIISNDAGTAPGFKMQVQKAWIYFLPGPPGEAQKMFQTRICPDLEKSLVRRGSYFAKRLHFFGISESELGEKIQAQMRRGNNPSVGTSVRKGTITVHIVARAASVRIAKKMAIAEAKALREQFGQFLFGEDGVTLAESLAQTLIQKKISLATAESCTGGLCGKLITDVPGISAIYRGGVISYSNSLKEKFLSVPKKLLERHGAVSEEVAEAMAKGVASSTQAKLAIAITGIAGPAGGSTTKPVGLVYTAVYFQGKTKVAKKLYPPGDRKRIRELAARDALHLARQRVLEES